MLSIDFDAGGSMFAWCAGASELSRTLDQIRPFPPLGGPAHDSLRSLIRARHPPFALRWERVALGGSQEDDHGEEGKIEDQKRQEGENGSPGAQKEARSSEEERSEEVGLQEGETEGPQGCTTKASAGIGCP